ncbi:hypothetical protein WJ968_20120 [Achromobacter xylosoxidans]
MQSETDGAGGLIQRSYDAFGNEIQRITRIDGTKNRTDTREYDRLGRLTLLKEDAGAYDRKTEPL